MLVKQDQLFLFKWRLLIYNQDSFRLLISGKKGLLTCKRLSIFTFQRHYFKLTKRNVNLWNKTSNIVENMSIKMFIYKKETENQL